MDLTSYNRDPESGALVLPAASQIHQDVQNQLLTTLINKLDELSERLEKMEQHYVASINRPNQQN